MKRYKGPGVDFREVLNEELKDPAFAEAYEKTKDMDIPYEIREVPLGNLRKKKGLTQKKLAEKTGYSQADISRLESGKRKPSLRTLSKIAESLDMELHITFVPKRK